MYYCNKVIAVSLLNKFYRWGNPQFNYDTNFTESPFQLGQVQLYCCSNVGCFSKLKHFLTDHYGVLINRSISKILKMGILVKVMSLEKWGQCSIVFYTIKHHIKPKNPAFAPSQCWASPQCTGQSGLIVWPLHLRAYLAPGFT